MRNRFATSSHVPLLACTALLTAFFTTSSLAETIAMHFDVNVSGMKAMKLAFNGDISTTTYAGQAELKPRGFAKLFIKKSFRLSVKGRLKGNQVHPEHFTMTIRKKRNERTASLRWKDERINWQRTPPKSPEWRNEVARTLSKGVMDPLSMLVQFARRQNGDFCKGRKRIFDGFETYDIIARKLGQKTIRSAVYSGPAVVCRLQYVPVAGLSEKKMRRRRADPPVYITYLARVKSTESGALFIPVRIEGRFEGRPFKAQAISARLGGSPLRPAGN